MKRPTKLAFESKLESKAGFRDAGAPMAPNSMAYCKACYFWPRIVNERTGMTTKTHQSMASSMLKKRLKRRKWKYIPQAAPCLPT